MPKLSLAMIVKDESDRLKKCLSSVKHFVNEIIIVDTGSLDDSKAVAKAYGAKVFDFTAKTHPKSFLLDKEIDGVPGPYTHTLFLADFAGARNYAYEQATNDYLMWLDGDDWVEHPENIPKVLEQMEKNNIGVMFFPYDWALDKAGNTIASMKRDRICHRKTQPKWHGIIHECLIGTVAAKQENSDLIRIKQDRGSKNYLIKYRNYKVLLEQYRQEKEAGKVGSRTLYYLGQEARGFNQDKMVEWLTEYMGVAKWRHEKAIAHGYLGQYWERKKDYVRALTEHAAAAIEDPDVFEGWYGLGRMAYYMERWEESIEFFEKGFGVDRSKRKLTDNLMDRDCSPHYYYNIALSKVGRVQDALKSVQAGLVLDPTNTWLVTNQRVYSEYLEKKEKGK